MEKLKALFNNPPKAIVGILAVIVLFLLYLAFGPTAKAAEFEVGPTFTGEFNGGFGIMFSERWADKIDTGVALISEQEWESVKVGNNGNVWVAYAAQKPENWTRLLPSEMSIGAAMWIKTQSPINGCQLGYKLGLKYVFGRATVSVHHWSNAGSCKPNRGQDILTFGWRF